MYCKNCGSEIPNDSKFCNECGQDLVDIPVVRKQEPSQPIYTAPVPVPAPVVKKKAKKSKGLKIAFFSLLGVVVVLAIVLVVILVTSESLGKSEALAILNDEPAVDLQSLTSGESEEFSLANIGDFADCPVDWYGVWLRDGVETNPDKDIENGVDLPQSSDDDNILVIFSDLTMHEITQRKDGSLSQNDKLDYVVFENHIATQDPDSDIRIKYFVRDEKLALCIYVGETPITDYMLFVRQDISLKEGEFYRTAKVEEAEDESGLKEYTSPVFATQTSIDTVLTSKEWSLVGIADNPTLTGQDGDFTLADIEGISIKFYFFKDGALRDIREKENEKEEVVLYYEIEDYHYCRTLIQEVDGIGYSFYLGEDGLLYMSLYGDIEGNGRGEDMTDYLVFEPLDKPGDITSPGPLETDEDDAMAIYGDSFPNGLVEDINSYIEGKIFIASGNTVAHPAPDSTVPGYPSVHVVNPGAQIYTFFPQTQTFTIVGYDTDGNIVGEIEADYIIDPNGFYIYAHNRMQEVAGVEYKMSSRFFISDGNLYEVEITNGKEASNYIEYVLYEP